jgi:CubicO group peptidase (beta-lactamase class C family)
MSTGGLSQARLGRMHDVMAGYVERGEVPGIVTLVSRRGEVHVDAIGMEAVGGSDPIRHDTIFRITSMTKPITAAATMILVEECKLRLDEPVDRLLPELAGRRVLKRLDGPLDNTVPAHRPITGRERILSRLSVETMTTDQLTPEQQAESRFFLGDSRGWGFGVSIVTRRDDVAAVPGRFGWDGGYGTSWSSDPKEDMVAILMTQCLWNSPSPPGIYLDFWTLAYQTIDD